MRLLHPTLKITAHVNRPLFGPCGVAQWHYIRLKGRRLLVRIITWLKISFTPGANPALTTPRVAYLSVLKTKIYFSFTLNNAVADYNAGKTVVFAIHNFIIKNVPEFLDRNWSIRLTPGLPRVLHAHGGVQAVQGPLRQDGPEAAAERSLLVHDPRKIRQRNGQWHVLVVRDGVGRTQVFLTFLLLGPPFPN
jgi:hypothetical protein